jgi:hypothetical protein
VPEPDLDDARRRYHFALAPEDYERLPFYSALLRELEVDPLALELLAGVRVGQRNPMLVLATLHLAALRGHPVLGPIYDAARHGFLEDPAAAARTVLKVLHESPALVRDELWRSTQTNEPGRSAILQAVVADLAGRPAREVNVVEIGTSAGINLGFDQFPVRSRDDGDPLTLVCEDLGPVDRRGPLPVVRARVGVDPHPLSLERDDDRRWLKACLWPEERRRHERFDAVVAVHPSWPPSTILEGSALERLGDAMALVEARAMTIVFNSWVAFYFTPAEREDYFVTMTERCAETNTAWISIESTLIQWPGVAVDNVAHRRGASQIVVTRPGESPVNWGRCHSHGRWLERTTRA